MSDQIEICCILDVSIEWVSTWDEDEQSHDVGCGLKQLYQQSSAADVYQIFSVRELSYGYPSVVII